MNLALNKYALRVCIFGVALNIAACLGFVAYAPPDAVEPIVSLFGASTLCFGVGIVANILALRAHRRLAWVDATNKAQQDKIRALRP